MTTERDCAIFRASLNPGSMGRYDRVPFFDPVDPSMENVDATVSRGSAADVDRALLTFA